MDAWALSVGAFSRVLGSFELDRPVVDKTGITGMFDFHLTYAAPDSIGGTTIFAALQDQLGLKLDATKAPVKVRVIDHAERPSPDGQSAAVAVPKFDVTSVKPCAADDSLRGRLAAGGDTSSIGRLDLPCQFLPHWIELAYVRYPTSKSLDPLSWSALPIEGGPTWLKSDRYEITATAEGNPGESMMYGPMLQALLEDRFKLVLHRETRQVPVHELTVEKGGLKLTLTPPGSCTEPDVPDPWPWPLPPHECAIAQTSDAGKVTVDVRGRTLSQVASYLQRFVAGPVIDKTGIPENEKFDMHLEFSPDETMPRLQAQAGDADASGPAFPSLSAAFQRLGLKYSSAKGPGQFLVIDHVERPAPNLPSPSAPFNRGLGAASPGR